MIKQYHTYAEIPLLIKEYILTVAEEKHIMDISLEDINSFIYGLHEYYENQPEEEIDGWAQ